MATYKTPGVYVEEIKQGPASTGLQPTSVPVFIGHTARVTGNDGAGVILKPVKVSSLIEFSSLYGDDAGGKYLFDAVSLFYSNGGTECYIISTGSVHDPVTPAALMNGLNSSKNIAAQLVVIPDACLLPAVEFYSLQQHALACCAELQDRFAIIDTLKPTADLTSDIEQFRSGIGNDHLQWGAAYYPWLVLPGGKLLPPSGAIAGIYAMVDSTLGVWKAPANVGVNGVADVSVHINSDQQKDMNVSIDGRSVNAIRIFIGRGALVWGARTLDGNNQDWKYIPVRRTITMIENSIKTGTGWVVFEPNDENTWAKLRSQIRDLLIQLWKMGGLMGNKAEEAFSVQVGLGTTMTETDIQERRLNITVLVAITRPTEFIEITFTRNMVQS